MAKGTHSKRRKRNQSIKRKVLWEAMYKQGLEDTSKRLMKRTFGKGDDSVITQKKNAFRFPKDPDAEFPKHPDPVFIERRSAHINRDILVKDIGKKHSKVQKEKEQAEFNKALQVAKEKINGVDREGKVIDLNEIYKSMNVDDELENLAVDKIKINKKKKNKQNIHKNELNVNMDGEDLDKKGKSAKIFRRKKKGRSGKRSKNSFIVNY